MDSTWISLEGDRTKKKHWSAWGHVPMQIPVRRNSAHALHSGDYEELLTTKNRLAFVLAQIWTAPAQEQQAVTMAPGVWRTRWPAQSLLSSNRNLLCCTMLRLVSLSRDMATLSSAMAATEQFSNSVGSLNGWKATTSALAHDLQSGGGSQWSSINKFATNLRSTIRTLDKHWSINMSSPHLQVPWQACTKCWTHLSFPAVQSVTASRENTSRGPCMPNLQL